jgi:rod shape-determining protein MreD
MQKLIILLTVFISILLESALFRFFAVRGVVPNLTLILILCYALYYEEDKTAFIGLLAGLTKDITVGRIVGISAISFMLIGYLTAHYNQKIFAEHVTTPVILTVAATLFHETIYLFFIFFLGYQVHLMYTIPQVWAVQAVYNAVMTVPVYFAMRRLLHWHVMK